MYRDAWGGSIEQQFTAKPGDLFNIQVQCRRADDPNAGVDLQPNPGFQLKDATSWQAWVDPWLPKAWMP